LNISSDKIKRQQIYESFLVEQQEYNSHQKSFVLCPLLFLQSSRPINLLQKSGKKDNPSPKHRVTQDFGAMSTTITQPLSLEEFLKLPETKPASEYINGEIIQKPIPKGRHSRLQGKLCAAINYVAEEKKIAYAFPELRCTFGERSIVPDVAVFQWKRISLTSNDEVLDNFELSPDWTIEILSPEQKPNKVIGNILHCLKYGSRLGWFLDPDDLSILVFLPEQQQLLLQGKDPLPVLPEIELALTAEQVFGWLKMGS
jgi:Uma2 family endonuclease